MGLLDELKADASELGVTLGLIGVFVVALWLWQKGTWAIVLFAVLLGAGFVGFSLWRRG